MSAVIGALRAALSLDSTAFESGSKRASASMTGLQKKLAATASKMKAIGKRMSLAVTAPLAGMATLAVKSALSVVDAQAKMAQSMQTSVKSIQVLSRAGELAGVSMGEIETATRDLTKRLSQAAAGGGPAVKTLDRLGLSAKELMRLPLDEQVAKINGALAEFVPAAERGAVASDLFGSRGFLAMQRIDTATLRTATQDVEDFGIAVSEMDADQIERTNDAISRLGLVGRGVGNQLAVAFAPTLELIANKAAEAAKWFNNLSDRTQRFIGIGAAVAAAIGPVAMGLGLMLITIGPLTTAIGGLIAGAVGLAAALWAVPGVAIFAGIGAVLASVYKGFRDSREAAERYAAAIKNLVGVQESLNTATETYYSNMTRANLDAMKLQATRARDAIATALQAAQAELEAAAWFTKAFGVNLYETDRMSEARAAIGKLAGQLFQAESRLSAAEHAASNFNGTVRETGTVIDTTTASTAKMATAAYSVIPAIDELRGKYGGMATAIRAVLEAQNALAVMDAQSLLAVSDVVSKIKTDLGLGADKVAVFKAELEALKSVDSFQQQATALARMADYLANDVNGGLKNMSAETRAVYQALLDAAQAAAVIGQQVAVAQASTTRLGAVIVQLAPQFAPAVAMANKLSTALGGVLSQLGGIARGLASLSPIGTSVSNVIGSLGGVFKKVATDGVSAAARGLSEVGGNLKEVWQQAGKSNASVKTLSDFLKNKFKPAASGSGGASGAAQNLGKELRAAEREARKLKETMDRPFITVIDGASTALGDFVTAQIRNFEDFGAAIFESIKSAISQSVAFAIANPIKAAFGLSGSVGAAAQAAGGGAGGGSGLLGSLAQGAGVIGKIFGGVSAFTSGISTGLYSIATGFLGPMGSLATGFSTLSTAIGGAFTGGMAGLGTAIGAALPVVGVVVAGIALLSKAFSRKYAGTALRGAIGADGFEGSSFDFYKGGLFRSNKEVHSEVPAELQAMLDATVTATRDSIHQLADVLSLGSKKIDKFTGDAFTIWTSGKTQEEIAAALNAELTKVAEGMADLVLKSDRWSRAGETALETLTRLGTSLIAANDTLDLLGHSAFRLSLRGGDAASALVDVFGGLEGLQSAAGSYFSAFYSQEEQVAAVTRALGREFEALGAVLPKSRAGYRALVEAQNLNTESGRALYATLIGLADSFDMILPVAQSLTAVMQGMADGLVSDIDARLSDATELARISKQASSFWVQTADGLRDFLRDMAGSDLSGTSGAQQFLAERTAYLTALSGVNSGDAGAAKDLAGVARSYLETASLRTKDSLEFARIAGKVRADLSLAAGISDLEAGSEEVMRNLAETQIAVLGQLKDYVLAGNIDADVLKGFSGDLTSLEAAIKQAEMFSYDYLQERLKVTVDVLADASIPKHLRILLANAATGIESTIDFLVRSTDLTPDLKWIALQSSTEHLKSLRFIVKKDLPNALKRIAIDKVSRLDKTLNLIAGSDVSRDLKSLALTSTSSLSTTVSALLNRPGSNAKALRLALESVGGYTANVNAVLVRSGLAEDAKRIVLAQAGTYSAGILASIDAKSLSDRARRILLRQQGVYVANIFGALDAKMSDNARALLLEETTNGFRTITLNKVDLSGLSKKNKWLLDAIGGSTDGTVVMSGGFAFDPSAGFKTWFEGSTEVALTKPMSELQASISALRTAVIMDLNQRKAESDKAAGKAAEEAKLADLKNSQSKAIVATQKIIDQIKALEIATNTDMRYKNGDNILEIDENGLVRNQSDGQTTGGDLQGFREAFYGVDGLQAKLFGNKAILRKLFAQIEKQTSALVGMNADVTSLSPPSVAEWEMAPAPNSGPQMAAQSVEGLSDPDPLRAEITAMRSEQRQLLLAIERNTDDIAVKTRRFDAIGMKARKEAAA